MRSHGQKPITAVLSNKDPCILATLIFLSPTLLDMYIYSDPDNSVKLSCLHWQLWAHREGCDSAIKLRIFRRLLSFLSRFGCVDGFNASPSSSTIRRIVIKYPKNIIQIDYMQFFLLSFFFFHFFSMFFFPLLFFFFLFLLSFFFLSH